MGQPKQRRSSDENKVKSHSSRNARTKTRKGLGPKETVLAGLILVILVWVVYAFSQTPQSVNPGTQTSGAPDFTLPIVGPNGLTGEKIVLSSLRGKVVLLEFMVPWCVHCQKMAPVLEKLHQQFGRGNVVLLSVSGSWQGTSAADAAKFIRDYGSSWVHAYDSSGSVFNMYGVSGTPTFFVIAKNGSIVDTYQGEVSYETLAAVIARFTS